MIAENTTLLEQGLLAMRRARAALVLEHPFFASLALRLTLKPDATCRDVWSDGRTMGFNPVYAATLSEPKLIGIQAHELMHLACGHHVRRQGRDERLWNRACDYAVNHLLVDAGFTLPDGFLYDAAYTEQSVDAIYATLARLQEEEANGGAEQALQSETSLAEQGGASDSGQGEEEEGDTGSGHGAGEGETLDGESEHAPNAGRAREGERTGETVSAHLQDVMGEVRDHPLLDNEHDAARQAAEQEADISLVQAMQRALHMGDVPAGFTRLLRETLRPQLDWRGLLQRFLEHAADSDFSWSTPNRRYVFQGLYLPSRREPTLPCVVLAVDSSGSVDEALLALFCAELSSILEAYDTELVVLYHDTEVYPAGVYTRQDMPFTLSPVGGGGTDYRPVCAYLEAEGLAPACLLWFTDMECTRFPEEPPYPVLWLSTGEAETPPFGEVVRLPRQP